MATALILVNGLPGAVVLESWWFRPRDLGFVTGGRRRCGGPATLEVWCDVPAELALARCRGRRRGAPYEDDRRLSESWPQWAAEAEPLRVGATLVVETDRPVDVRSLVDRITVGGRTTGTDSTMR